MDAHGTGARSVGLGKDVFGDGRDEVRLLRGEGAGGPRALPKLACLAAGEHAGHGGSREGAAEQQRCPAQCLAPVDRFVRGLRHWWGADGLCLARRAPCEARQGVHDGPHRHSRRRQHQRDARPGGPGDAGRRGRGLLGAGFRPDIRSGGPLWRDGVRGSRGLSEPPADGGRGGGKPVWAARRARRCGRTPRPPCVGREAARYHDRAHRRAHRRVRACRCHPRRDLPGPHRPSPRLAQAPSRPGRAGQRDPGVGASEMAPGTRVLRGLALARYLGARWWRRAHEPGDSHRRPAPVAAGGRAARLRRHAHIEVEDTAVACLEFASGAIGTLEAATSAFPGFPRRVELTGSEGTIVLEHDRVVAVRLRTPAEPPPEDEGSGNESATSPVMSDVRGHARVLKDFVHAIRSGAAPVCDGREGRRSVAMVEALYRSARIGMAETVPVAAER